jgi:ATP-binding cassette subfamily C protein
VQDLSFTIPAGSSVALVGPTGRGKTTAVKLILGLLTPEAGGVLVDGNGLGGRDASARLHVGYISQFIYLRDDTIRRNVALGLPDAEIAEWRMRTALHAAQLEEFVASLPAGVQTIVGERGVRLSGGQRQRIGIARALYSDPSLLVMDEGTSALDAGTEKAVVDTVLEARGERTLIMIAHRMSTVKWCDQLYYLDGGELVAQGTYKDLYAQRSRLSAMAG